VAEKQAIRLALEFAIQNEDMADEFVIRTDCTEALDHIMAQLHGQGGLHDIQAFLSANKIRALQQRGKRVELAYVKAHDDGRNPGCEGNIHADKLAREGSAIQAGLEVYVKEVWLHGVGGTAAEEAALARQQPPGRPAPWLAAHISELY
jgi:ribonuclease HI